MTAIWQFMKRNYKVLLLVVALAAALWSFIPFKKTNDPDPEKEAFLIGVLNFVLQNAHYHPAEINDEFSEKVYNNYRALHYKNEKKENDDMKTVFVQVVERPERKCLLKRGEKATEYFEYCEEKIRKCGYRIYK